MTTADQADQESSIPTSRKLLCVAYGAIAITGLIAMWSQNLAYFDKPARFPIDFMNDSKVTAASRSLSVDLVLFSLAAVILMVIEARKRTASSSFGSTLRADSPSRSASRFLCF